MCCATLYSRDEDKIREILDEASESDELLTTVLEAKVTESGSDSTSESSRDERLKMMLGMSAFMLAAHKVLGDRRTSHFVTE